MLLGFLSFTPLKPFFSYLIHTLLRHLSHYNGPHFLQKPTVHNLMHVFCPLVDYHSTEWWGSEKHLSAEAFPTSTERLSCSDPTAVRRNATDHFPGWKTRQRCSSALTGTFLMSTVSSGKSIFAWKRTETYFAFTKKYTVTFCTINKHCGQTLPKSIIFDFIYITYKYNIVSSMFWCFGLYRNKYLFWMW